MTTATERRGKKTPRTIVRDGKRYVEIPADEYRRLKTAAANAPEPPLPAANASGNYPAIETMQALLARDVLRDRRRLGLTQPQLAELAGVRVETICRIETGKHTPTVATMEKIDAAIKRAEAGRKRKPRTARPA